MGTGATIWLADRPHYRRAAEKCLLDPAHVRDRNPTPQGTGRGQRLRFLDRQSRRRATGGGDCGYMPNAGFPEVRAAIAGSLAARTGIAFTADDVLMTTGAAGAINIVLKSILDPGDEVILLNPCFPEYRLYVENHAGSVVSVETDECFQPDVRRISEAITPRTKALIVNSPNNPTGAVYDAGVLRARHSRSRADTGHQRRALSPAGLRRAQASRDARHHPEIGAGLVVVEGHGDCRRAHRLSGDSPAS